MVRINRNFFKKIGGLAFILFAIILITDYSTSHRGLKLILFSILTFLTIPVRKYINIKSFLIALFSISYGIIVFLNHDLVLIDSFILCFPFIFFYWYGCYIGYENKRDSILFFIVVFSIFLLASSCYFIVFNDILVRGEIINRDMTLGDEERYLAATLMVLKVLPSMIGGAMLISCVNLKSKFKWFFFFIFIASIIVSLHNISRTGILTAFIMIILGIILGTLQNGIKLIPFLLLLLFSGIFFTFYSFNYSNPIIASYVARSYDLSSMGDRSWRWFDALNKLFDYPYGWLHSYNTFNEYVHNMWLDIARFAGLIPFVCILIVTIMSIIKVFSIFKKERSNFVFMLLYINICMLIGALMEPVVEGLPLFLYFYLFIWGIQDGYYLKYKSFNHLLS